MDGKVTVDVKSILLAALVLLGLVAAYLVGSAGDSPRTSAVAAEGDEADPRSVVMTGTGRATTVPDELSYTVAVGVTRTDVEDAMDEANATMAKVLKALAPYGVTRKDTETTGLPKAGKAISATVAAGGNAVRVRGISLGISDRDAVLEEARDRAVEQATTNARQYAAATGQELGDVLSLKEVSATRPTSYGRDRYQLADLDLLSSKSVEAVPIRAGEEELAVTVQVVWSFV